MDSRRFSLGMMFGALAFALVMGNLWFWGVVPVETMYAFDRNPHNQFMMIGIALATMFCGGFLGAALGDRKKK